MSVSTPDNLRTNKNSLSQRFMDLMDPRSPTTEFQRTPIQILVRKWNSMSDEVTSMDSGCGASTNGSVENTSTLADKKENDKSTSSSTDVSYVSLDDISLDTIELSDFDLSKMISQLNDSCNINIDSAIKSNSESPVAQKIDGDYVKIENKPTLAVDPHEMENEVPTKNKDIEPIKRIKNMFYTPTKKSRAPLEPVDNVCPSTPPSHFLNSSQNSFHEKQWKRIHEERKKRGLESNENLPLPLMDVTASAPSKLVYRKRTTDNKVNLSKLL